MLKKIALSALFAITFAFGIAASAAQTEVHTGTAARATHLLCPTGSCTGSQTANL